jgi:hypothetical protein
VVTAPTATEGYPVSGLILCSITLYGMGGSSGSRTVFSLSLPPPLLPPQLTLALSKSGLVLMWPSNYIGFALRSTTNFTSPVWTTNLWAPVVVNGQNTVTNQFSDITAVFPPEPVTWHMSRYFSPARA